MYNRFFPNLFQNLAPKWPKSSQDPPKSSPNRPQIVPRGLLTTMLDQCLQKAGFLSSKKRPGDAPKWPRGAQKGPRGAQKPPKTVPNGAQDPPKPTF